MAPPYDVIDASEAVALRDRSPRNCVRLILPEGTADDRYESAGRLFRDWRRDGFLIEDPRPAVYVYRQEFAAQERRVQRTALFCALRLTPFEAGHVLPHERTHAGPKQDRLALTLAARAQLSPVFLVARDPDASLHAGLAEVTAGSAAWRVATPDGVSHSLWVVDDPARGQALRARAGMHPLLIADGHHRYETALAVKDALGDCVKARDLLVCIVSQRDPGLIVQPTHRVLSGPPAEAGSSSRPGAASAWRAALAERFTIRDIERRRGPDLETEVRAAGKAGLIAVAGHPDARAWLLAPANGDAARRRPGGTAGHLAAVVFDSEILHGLYGVDADEAARAGILSYSRDPEEAIAGIGDTGCAFLLPPVPPHDVWAAAAEGVRLPPKSTYFEPKVPSGLLFRPLD